MLFIGRQYRNTAGAGVAIGYERPGDGGRARVAHNRVDVSSPASMTTEECVLPPPVGEVIESGPAYSWRLSALTRSGHGLALMAAGVGSVVSSSACLAGFYVKRR